MTNGPSTSLDELVENRCPQVARTRHSERACPVHSDPFKVHHPAIGHRKSNRGLTLPMMSSSLHNPLSKSIVMPPGKRHWHTRSSGCQRQTSWGSGRNIGRQFLAGVNVTCERIHQRARDQRWFFVVAVTAAILTFIRAFKTMPERACEETLVHGVRQWLHGVGQRRLCGKKRQEARDRCWIFSSRRSGEVQQWRCWGISRQHWRAPSTGAFAANSDGLLFTRTRNGDISRQHWDVSGNEQTSTRTTGCGRALFIHVKTGTVLPRRLPPILKCFWKQIDDHWKHGVRTRTLHPHSERNNTSCYNNAPPQTHRSQSHSQRQRKRRWATDSVEGSEPGRERTTGKR